MPSALDPDRLFPPDAGTRQIARDLYAAVADAPIISPHGHVPAELIADDTRLGDPAELFVSRDHYVTRILHAAGVPLDALGVGTADADPREVWRLFAAHQRHLAGTASSLWLQDSFATVLGEDQPLSPENADTMYDRIDALLDRPEMRPRALLDRFDVAVLATTDDPLSDLAAHRALREDPSFTRRLIPTFRPDHYIDPAAPTFIDCVTRLFAETGMPATFRGLLDGLRVRRAHFVDHGATSVDVGVAEPRSIELDAAEAETLVARALAGTATDDDARRLRGHLLWRTAEMSVDDGLVLTIHPGVHRNHSRRTYERFGPDTGHDIPMRTSFTNELRPMLESFGLEPGFQLVLFAVDETVYSRELAPLAGFYPSVFVGAPWWFLDAPDAIQRWRSAVTETAGFYRTSGFIDDTRAFLSIPARHDVARRADAAFLARYVREGRIARDTASAIAADLVDAVPRRAFKL